MSHTIQIIIDNAGNINLRIDEWYHEYTIENAGMCVSDIIEAQHMHHAMGWSDWIDGYDSDLASSWDTIDDDPQCITIDSSAELTEGVGGHAGEALRRELKKRSVTF